MPNKTISLFLVTGLKILGTVGTHITFICFVFFLKKNMILLHFERHFAFQNAENYIFFPEKLKTF